MEREQFAGLALLKIARCQSSDELSAVARDVKIAKDHGDVTEAQYAALVAAGKQRRLELNGERNG